MIKELTKKLKRDPELYYAYQANIAMPFKDRCAKAKKEGQYLSAEVLHTIANEAAKDFLNLLIKETK